MFVIFSAQVLNRAFLQGNGHGLACKLRGFALGGNGHGPVEQTEEVNIPNSATSHENERVYMCILTKHVCYSFGSSSQSLIFDCFCPVGANGRVRRLILYGWFSIRLFMDV